MIAMKMRIILILLFNISCSLNLLAQTVEDLIDEGYAHYESQNYEEALKVFDKAAELDSQNAQIYYLRGATKSLLDKNEEAIKDLTTALELEIDYPEAYFERGYVYVLLNKPSLAVEDFSKAIEFYPEYGEAYLNRGTVKCMMADKKGAEEDWQKAEQLGMSVPFAACD